MKSKKRKPWLGWLLGIVLCLLIPASIVGKAAWSEFRAKVGSNKTFVTSLVKDFYEGKNISRVTIDPAQAKAVLDEATHQLGKFLEFDSIETVAHFNDAISRGWELSYRVPVHFEKGYKTFTIRVRNEGLNQRVVWITSEDGLATRKAFKEKLKLHLP